MRASLLALTTLLFSLLGAHAQDAVPEKKPTKGISVHLLAVELLKGMEEVVITSGEKRSKPLFLPTHGFSEPHRISVRTLQISDPPVGEKPGRPLAKVTLPEAGKKFLLICVPSKNNYHVKVIRLDDPTFKDGDICFYNVSAVPVAGTLGSQKFLAPPGKPKMVSPPKQDELPYYQVQLFYSQKGKSRPLADTRWPYAAQNRSYVFFYLKTKTGRLSYRAVDEHLPDSL